MAALTPPNDSRTIQWIDLQMRTARVRVEVPIPDRRLKLGMYVTLAFMARGGAHLVVVPHTAVQTIGECHVVFMPVPDEAGRFVQRVVQLGPLVDDSYTVHSGLAPGELVVTEDSFFLRAEMLRNTSS